jgi:hypothetical protein
LTPDASDEVAATTLGRQGKDSRPVSTYMPSQQMLDSGSGAFSTLAFSTLADVKTAEQQALSKPYAPLRI